MLSKYSTANVLFSISSHLWFYYPVSFIIYLVKLDVILVAETLVPGLRLTAPSQRILPSLNQTLLNSKSTVALPVRSFVLGIDFLSTPIALAILFIVLRTQSCSVPTSSGCACLHLVTMLAVPRLFSRASNVVSLPPPKKSSPLVRTPFRSHSCRTCDNPEKALTGGVTAHGNRRFS